jgi:hypothetical protein
MTNSLSDSMRASFDESSQHPCCCWERTEHMRQQRDNAIRERDALRQAYEVHTSFTALQDAERERLRSTVESLKAQLIAEQTAHGETQQDLSTLRVRLEHVGTNHVVDVDRLELEVERLTKELGWAVERTDHAVSRLERIKELASLSTIKPCSSA